MSLTCGFYNSSGGDRKYNAEQMSKLFDGLITDGVYQSIGEAMVVKKAGGLALTIGPGRAWFYHTWTENDTPYHIVAEDSDLILDRIDTVVLDIDASSMVRDNSYKIVKGQPGSNPKPPVLLNEVEHHQVPLALLKRKAGSSEITEADIDIQVGKTDCPFVAGVLKGFEITPYFRKMEAEFENWFNEIKGQLSGDVAANLQRQIMDIREKGATKDDLNGVLFVKSIDHDRKIAYLTTGYTKTFGVL